MTVFKEVLLYGASQSAASTVTSAAFDLGSVSLCSIHVDFSGGAGDLAGTLTLEASNDNTDFITLSGSSQAVASSASHLWNISPAAYRYLRVKYTATSGTGNIQARLVAKGA